MDATFDRILNGQEPERVIFESDRLIAFVDDQPLVMGHVLVIPKQRQDYIFDLPDQELSEFLVLAKPIAAAIKKVIPCEKVGIACIGLVTRYAHLHLVPISSADDLNFTRKRLKPSASELTAIANQIRTAL